jgi:hypothetical protein
MKSTQEKPEQKMRVMTFADLNIESDEQFDDLALTQKKFEILRVGEFFDERYGKFAITEERLRQLKENFDRNVLDIDVAIDLNHDPTQGAFGWINTLSVEDGKLFMTLKDITEEGRKILKEKKFKYFSVEFAPFTTVVEGEKTTINDVLRGVALTNRPVIKGMQPTFLSEDVNNSFISKKTMNLLLKLAENMLSRDDVSKADANFLRAQFDETPQEEKTEELEEKVAEVEAKAEEAEAETEEAKAEEPEAEGEPEAEETKEPEAVKASEVTLKLAEANKKITALEVKESQRVTADRVSSLTLSEQTKVGFTKETYSDLSGFIASLSESQYKAFEKLVPRVVNTTVLSEELGSSLTGVKSDVDSKLSEAKTLSEKYISEGMEASEAIRKAQKEVGV